MRERVTRPVRRQRVIAALVAVGLAWASLLACAAEQREGSGGPATRKNATPTSGPHPSTTPSSTSSVVVPFTPEPYGHRLRPGASGQLRQELAPGQNDMLAVHDTGTGVDALGDAAVVTAVFGAYRDDKAPCPDPWETLIRWGRITGRSHVWRAKVAPQMGPVPTSVGFIIPFDPCIRGHGHVDEGGASVDWYIDSHGRIGELRPIVGDPPKGVVADAPMSPNGLQITSQPSGNGRTLLAERWGDRVWAMDAPTGAGTNYAGGPTGVLAQDVTGRQWFFEDSDGNKGQVSWSDDLGLTWSSHWSRGSFFYTDRTIGFVGRRKVTVSTDRGATWTTRSLPNLAELALPMGQRPRDWASFQFATRSGVLVFIYSLASGADGVPTRSYLLRSTDSTWTRFARPRQIPSQTRWDINVNTLTGCVHAECAMSKDLGETWHPTHMPD